MTTTAKAVGYWTTTAILAFALLGGGIAELVHEPATVAGMKHLGYPVYVATNLGFWKVLGSLALLAPGLPRVKEWAYAGIFFDVTGAAVSHAACGDATWHIVVTLGFAALAVASWALRPAGSRLGVLFASADSSPVAGRGSAAGLPSSAH